MIQKQNIHHIIVPGYGNSGKGHWQTLWQNKLGHCQRFSPTSWDHPNRDDWVAALERVVDEIDGPIVLIAHSLGCITVAEWAVIHNCDKILGALLVAIPDVQREDFPKEITGYEDPSLTSLPFNSIAVLSSNDPYSALDRGTFFAERFDSRIKEIGPKGHINHESGLAEWKQGLGWLEELKANQNSAVA